MQPYVAFWERPLWLGRDNMRDGAEPFWMRLMAPPTTPRMWDANTMRWQHPGPARKVASNWIEETNRASIAQPNN